MVEDDCSKDCASYDQKSLSAELEKLKTRVAKLEAYVARLERASKILHDYTKFDFSTHNVH